MYKVLYSFHILASRFNNLMAEGMKDFAKWLVLTNDATRQWPYGIKTKIIGRDVVGSGVYSPCSFDPPQQVINSTATKVWIDFSLNLWKISFHCEKDLSVFVSQAAEHLQSFIADCDRRTELAKKRLAETQDEISAEVAAKVTVSPMNGRVLTTAWVVG